MASAPIVASPLANQRMDRLRDLFGQIEREFVDLLEENAELRKQLADRGIPPLPPRTSADARSKSWMENKGNYLTQLKSRITTPTPPEKREWKFLREFHGHRDGVCEVRASQHTEHLLGSGSLDRTARVWTADDSAPPVVYVGHRGAVNSIRFHPREPLVVTASGDGSAHVWRYASSESEARPVRVAAAKPVATDLWTPLLNHPARPVPDSAAVVLGSSPAAAPSSLLASPAPPPVRRADNLQRSVELLEDSDSFAVPVRSPQLRLRGHTAAVAAADWLAAGEQLASGGADSTVRIWSAETGTCIAQVGVGSAGTATEAVSVTNVTTLPLSSLVAVSCSDGYFRVFDVRALNKQLAAAHSVLAHECTVSTAVLAATSASTLVVTGGGPLVRVWDLRKDKTALYTHRCSAPVSRLSVSPSGAAIAVPADNRHTKIIELAGPRVGQLNSHESEGHRMAVTSTAWATDESIVYTSSYDRYRSLLAWSFLESKEGQREAREAEALAKKSASAADRKAKREQKETKDAIKKQEKEAREVARKEQRERERKEEQERREKQKEEKKPDKKETGQPLMVRTPSLGGVDLPVLEAKAEKKDKSNKKDTAVAASGTSAGAGGATGTGNASTNGQQQQ